MTGKKQMKIIYSECGKGDTECEKKLLSLIIQNFQFRGKDGFFQFNHSVIEGR